MKILLFGLLLLPPTAGLALAQSVTGSIQGEVVDPSGAVTSRRTIESRRGSADVM